MHQPDVYRLANYLSHKTGRNTVLDLGCENSHKLTTSINQLSKRISAPNTVAICADVIAQAADPDPLLSAWRSLVEMGAVLVTRTPDRARMRGAEHFGSSLNKTPVREWTREELVAYLELKGLTPSFNGFTINNSRDCPPQAILTIHDQKLNDARRTPRLDKRPLAILSTYNEQDIIREVVLTWLKNGCDVWVLDNWSTDATFEILEGMRVSYGERVFTERFPEKPGHSFQLGKILARKEEIASRMPGRWIIHSDADEIRLPPWNGVTFAEGLAIVNAYGASRVDFTVLNFRPTAEQFFRGELRDLSYFEYGTRPGHFLQKKAWRQPNKRVRLADSGGHIAEFRDAVDFPYKFLLLHYPIRSVEHGRRKILEERKPRWSADERAKGWHTQYDEVDESFALTWDEKSLKRFDEETLLDELPILISDLSRPDGQPPLRHF